MGICTPGFPGCKKEKSQSYGVYRKPPDSIAGFVVFPSLWESVISSSAPEETLKDLHLARNAQETYFKLIQNLINMSQR